jgi:hypothetical protein
MQPSSWCRIASWVMAAAAIPGLLQAAPWAKYVGGADHEFPAPYARITPNADGSFYLRSGTRSYGAGGTDCLFGKLTNSGAALWAKTLGGKGDDFFTVVPTTDGGYFVGGYTTSYGTGNPDVTNFNVFYGKFNASWGTVAQKVWGGDLDETAEFMKTADGGFLFRGSSASYCSAPDTRDLVLFKVDASAVMQWRKVYSHGNDDVYGDTVEVLDGYVASFRTAEGDVILFKTTKTDGTILWRKKFHVASKTLGIPILRRTLDNGVLAAMSLGTNFDTRILLFKVAGADGAGIWKKTYSLPSSGVFPVSVVEKPNTSLILAGSLLEPAGTNFIRNSLVMKLSPGGTILTQTRLHVAGRHLDADVSSGGTVWSGVSFDPVRTNFDAVCAKLTKNTFTPVWAKTFGGANPESGIAYRQGTQYIFSGHTESLGGATLGKGEIFGMILTDAGVTPGAVSTLDLTGEAVILTTQNPTLSTTSTFSLPNRSTPAATSTILTIKAVSL